jgi:ribonuclease BN (tRNA processing enzyme)
MAPRRSPGLVVTFAGSGDAFGSGGRLQSCIHVQGPPPLDPVLVDCGATSLSALKRLGLEPSEVAAVFVSHLHGDHFGGLPFLILDGQFAHRTKPLTIAGPPGLAARLHDAMECLFPGSSTVGRPFDVDVIELQPGSTNSVAGITVAVWEVDHQSGAPPLALRLTISEKTIAHTGDTAWTEALIAVAADADLLIAEAYYREKRVPFHLRYADLVAHRDELTCARIIVTHMSDDVLGHPDAISLEMAHDGLAVEV